MEPAGPAPIDAIDVPRKTPLWRRIVAFLATFIFPGISQADDGEITRGAFWFLGLQGLLTASVVVLHAMLDRPWPSMAAMTAIFAVGFVLVLRLAIDGYRRQRAELSGTSMAVYVAFLIVAMVFGLVRGQVRERLVTSYRFPSISMEPTLMNGDKILVDRAAYRKGRRPKAGDVVVFILPEDRSKVFLKRVVAVPGDTVEIRHKKLLVNGKEIREEYAKTTAEEDAALKVRDNMPPVRLADGKYFLLGDNRDRSYDCRFFGPIDEKDIKGKAAFIYGSRELARVGRPIR